MDGIMTHLEQEHIKWNVQGFEDKKFVLKLLVRNICKWCLMVEMDRFKIKHRRWIPKLTDAIKIGKTDCVSVCGLKLHVSRGMEEDKIIDFERWIRGISGINLLEY